MIRFVNDKVIIIENVEDIQCASDEIEGTLSLFKMKTNFKKKKIMVCAKKPQNIVSEIFVDNHKLDRVSEHP